MERIVQKGNHILRKPAEKVPLAKINSWKIKRVLKRMHHALESRSDGVAIAAPQIGELFRIFIVSESMFLKEERPQVVFINPKLTSISEEKESMHEGCLSVNGLYGNVDRHVSVSVEAYDQNGAHFTKQAEGLLAQIFQHEIDHLNGILFIDKATKLEEIHNET